MTTEPHGSFSSLSGKTALVTGASSGIGRAIALEFARGGADVLVHCRSSEAKGAEVVAEIAQLGRRSGLLLADVRSDEDRETLLQSAYNSEWAVDVWVNNAGVDVLTTEARQLPYEERLKLLLETDVVSSAALGRRVASRMADRGSGAILMIGWDQADRGMEGESGELFAATKNAVMGLTRSLAVSFAPHVRVNCIAPGWIRTAWGETASAAWQERVMRETPLKRWGVPEDIAKTARFLCSDDAGYITGQVINVNGGAIR